LSLVIGAVILWIVPIFVANAMGRSKNRSGLAYGLLLGWVGVLILALLPAADPITLENIGRHRKRLGESQYHQLKDQLIVEARRFGECPFCKEQVRADATVCPHCQREMTPVVAVTPRV
jgi:hypothetical protein